MTMNGQKANKHVTKNFVKKLMPAERPQAGFACWTPFARSAATFLDGVPGAATVDPAAAKRFDLRGVSGSSTGITETGSKEFERRSGIQVLVCDVF